MAKGWRRWSKAILVSSAVGSWLIFTFVCIHQQEQRTALIYDAPELFIVLKRRPAVAGNVNKLNLLDKFGNDLVRSIQSAAQAQDHSDRLIELDEFVDKKIKESASGNITCDFSHFRTDVCYLQGDVRVSAGRVAIVSSSSDTSSQVIAKVKPYTRKWETSCMATIGEVSIEKTSLAMSCDYNHSVPAVVLSTGGYTGNVYHEFNDGLIPLFITSRKFEGEVVFLILELHKWWTMKYSSVVSRLSNYPVLDFDRSKHTHCFPQVTVGLQIHDELAIAANQNQNTTMHDFQQLLKDSFSSDKSRLQSMTPIPQAGSTRKPKLVIFSRKSSRVLLNQKSLIRLAKRIGFEVVVLAPNSHSSLFQLHEELHSAEVMVGVHGAALTHFLFLRPGSVFIQIVPLGTEWAAKTYYGEPAAKAGLEYSEYKIVVEESSLVRKLGREHTAVAHPEEITSKGWWEMKKIYLQNQDVVLNLKRFRPLLQQAFRRVRNSK